MGKSIRLGSILGLEIRLDYSWFLIFFVLSWTLGTGIFPSAYHVPPPLSIWLGVAAALLLFVSVLVHEMAHALVARSRGTEVAGITLFLFGGVAQIKSEPDSPRSEFLIAAVGPAVSVLIGVGCLAVWVALGGPFAFWEAGLRRNAAVLFNYLGVINIVLALFNLIPGFPMDGGRILRSALWAATGDLVKATKWASRGGQLFGWLFMAKGLWDVAVDGRFTGLWLVFIGWFLRTSAQAAYQQVMLKRALREVPVAEVLHEDAPPVDGDIRIPEFVERYLLRNEYRFYPVFCSGDFVGVVAAEDVAALERNLWGVTCVAALARMPEDEATVEESQDAWAALTQMLDSGVARLVVLRDGKAEGVVTRESILKLVQRRLRLGLSR